jgi:hypothetical protein
MTFSEKEEKDKMMGDLKVVSNKFQKDLADKEAADKKAAELAAAKKKKDDDDNVKESKVNKFTGLYKNDDGTRQFKELGKGKGEAGAFVGGVNDWHQSKNTVVADGKSVAEIKKEHKSHHHGHKDHAKHAQKKAPHHEKKAAVKTEEAAVKTEKVHAKKHHHTKHHKKSE